LGPGFRRRVGPRAPALAGPAGLFPQPAAPGAYGRRWHFWNLGSRALGQSIDLGDNGLIPLEVRWLHDPDAQEGYVGAALSSTMWRWYRANGEWAAEQVIAVDGVDVESWPFPVPGLISDLVLSVDDRPLYFSNWLHGDLRRYDVSDPSHPVLTGQLWPGGVRRLSRATAPPLYPEGSSASWT